MLALDPGFGETKVAFVKGEEIISFSFPSLVAEHVPSPLEADLRLVEFGGKSYVVGRHARVETGCRELYDYGDLVQALPLLFGYALTEAREMGFRDPEAVVVSVAPGHWPERERAERALSSFPGCGEVIVVPQGLGGYHLCRGQVPEGAEYVLVLDFGYNTVDWLLVEHGERYRVLKGATLHRMGVMKLVEIFRSELDGKLAELPPRVLREFLRRGGGKIYGEWLDLSGQRRRAQEKYGEALVSSLKREVGELASAADAVVCVGGGVHYVDPEREALHGVVVVAPRPEMANAEGQLLMVVKKF